MRITNRRRSCALGLLRRISVIGPVLAIILLPLLNEKTANAQCQYEITGIISPDDEDACWPFPPSNTYARGMNNNGEVVGYYVPCAVGNEKAFYWSEKVGFVTLPQPPGAVQAYATDINDHGYIVGQHVYSGVGSKGYIYNPRTGEFKYLEPLHKGATATNLTAANAINNQNTVVGDRVITEPGESPVIRNAVIWHPYGENGDGREVVIDLGDFGVGPNSSLRAVNSGGTHFVGWTGHSSFPSNGVSIHDGVATVFGPVPGTETSSFRSVSEDGLIAAHGINISRAFGRGALLMNGKWLVFDPPEGFQTTGTGKWSLNNIGQVLLGCTGGGLFRPFLWQHGEMQDLNDLLHEPPPSLLLTHPRGFNDTGQVLAHGTLDNKIVGVLLTPVDRPATDLNADCTTDVYDLLMLLGSWGPCGNQECAADFTRDDRVGVPDLLVLLANWG